MFCTNKHEQNALLSPLHRKNRKRSRWSEKRAALKNRSAWQSRTATPRSAEQRPCGTEGKPFSPQSGNWLTGLPPWRSIARLTILGTTICDWFCTRRKIRSLCHRSKRCVCRHASPEVISTWKCWLFVTLQWTASHSWRRWICSSISFWFWRIIHKK